MSKSRQIATTKILRVIGLIFCIGLHFLPVDLISQNEYYVTSYQDENPFEREVINYRVIDSADLKKIVPKINLLKTNVVCYRDSFWADTIKLAYPLNDKTKWISFVTPFAGGVIPNNYAMVELDKSGRKGIQVTGSIVYEPWPRGEYHNEAMIVYEIGTPPIRIFRMFCGCLENDVGTEEGEGAYDYTIGMNVSVKKGILNILPLEVATMKEGEKELLSRCHFTTIKTGKYKYESGTFRALR